jgi:hypothetical protein
MIEGLSGFLTALKQTSPLVFLAVAMASGIILFAPVEFGTTLGLVEFRDQNRSVLGGAFIFSLAVVLVNLLAKIGKWIRKRYRRHQNEKALSQSLEELTPEEKGYLVPYVHGEINTQHFHIEDGIAGGLVAKKILYRASNVFDMLQGPAYNIQPWAKALLNEKPGLL